MPAPRGDKVLELVDLAEIKERYGIGERAVYGMVFRGEIRAYGRPGRQKYYVAAEIEDWLNSRGSSFNGRQLSFGEFDDGVLSA